MICNTAQVVDEEKERRKAELARLVLTGQHSFVREDADVFEGLTPEEIQAYVSQATEGASSDDPFEVSCCC